MTDHAPGVYATPFLDRCTGQCCRTFHLGLSPEDIAEDLAMVEAGGISRYIGAEGVLAHVHLIQRTDVGGWYRCDLVTPEGNCSIYEKRPDMCKSYPNGHECSMDGCTWGAVAEVPAERLLGIRLPTGKVGG